MGLLNRLLWWRSKDTEGEYRPGPYYLRDGFLPAGTPLNFWQMGRNVETGGGCSAMVEACVSAYSQTVAMCPGDHWRKLDNGGRERAEASALTRIIRRPNDYQSISDFLLNAVRELYQTGEFFALALRNARNEISELHLMRSASCYPRLGEDGSVFYDLGGNPIIDRRLGALSGVPARDVLHVRLHTPRDPLKGESPIMAAALDMAASNAALQQHLAFLDNQAKPSFLLSTDQVLTAPQMEAFRKLWDEQTQGVNAGKTPILSAGMKAQQVGSNANDAQLAELMKMSDQRIAIAFRIPLQILGIGDTPFASTEALMQAWKANGLGFVLNHIEEAIGNLFGLAGYPYEYVEFDTDALLRSSFRERIEALARSTISGIHSPDEARNELDLPTAPGGHGSEPRVQQQVVPLSAWELQFSAPAPSDAPPAAPPADPSGAVDAQRSVDDIVRRIYDHSRALH